MTAAPYLIPSHEAELEGTERVWAHIYQFPPKKRRSSWWLVAAGAVLVAVAMWWL